jgi:hypothetical protein
MPQDPSLAASRLKPAARNGLSLACNDPPSQGFRPRVIDPGLLLRCSADGFQRPFGSTLQHSNRFAPARAPSPPETRCAFRHLRARLLLPLPLPFGDLTPLRIKAFRGARRRAACLPIRPISLRSPGLLLFLVAAPDHRSRSATFRTNIRDRGPFVRTSALLMCRPGGMTETDLVSVK